MNDYQKMLLTNVSNVLNRIMERAIKNKEEWLQNQMMDAIGDVSELLDHDRRKAAQEDAKHILDCMAGRPCPKCGSLVPPQDAVCWCGQVQVMAVGAGAYGGYRGRKPKKES